MEVFRITLAKYAQTLFAPGIPGRWNQQGQEVIYAASSRSLACLENLAHKRGLGLQQNYRTIVIHVPDELPVQQINLKDLPKEWNHSSVCPQCQQIGAAWYEAATTPLLKVPSAVIPYEWNYVIHAHHPDFQKITIISQEPFYFDPRLT